MMVHSFDIPNDPAERKAFLDKAESLDLIPDRAWLERALSRHNGCIQMLKLNPGENYWDGAVRTHEALDKFAEYSERTISSKSDESP